MVLFILMLFNLNVSVKQHVATIFSSLDVLVCHLLNTRVCDFVQ